MIIGYLGLKFDGHDTAAFLILPQSKQLCGLSTERLTRIKHDRLFPIHTIYRIFEAARDGLAKVQHLRCASSFTSHERRLYPVDKYESDVAARGLLFKPIAHLPTLAGGADQKANGLVAPLPHPAYERLDETILRCISALLPSTTISLKHFDHEYCHAQCAYQFSPYREALVLTMDGLGDDGVFSRAYVGKAGRLLPIAYSASAYRISSNGPHGRFSNPCSLGGIFTYFTCLIGFKPNCDEGKVEALAAFGRCLPTLHDALIKATKINSSTHAIDLDEEQLSRIFAACDVLTPNDTMRADIAATAQLFAEEILISYIKHLLALTGTRAVCLSGGGVRKRAGEYACGGVG